MTKACCFHAIWWLWIRRWRWLPWPHSKILGLDTSWLVKAAMVIFHVGVLLPTRSECWCVFWVEIPVTLLIASTFCAVEIYIYIYTVYISYSFYILIFAWTRCRCARNLVDTQPRYAYTTWAPKAKFCLQNQAAWNISRSRASPKRGSQGLERRCTLSPRIDSKPYTIMGMWPNRCVLAVGSI